MNPSVSRCSQVDTEVRPAALPRVQYRCIVFPLELSTDGRDFGSRRCWLLSGFPVTVVCVIDEMR